MKYILLKNNLGSKHSLLMKFGQFISYSKRNNFIKKLHKNSSQKTGSKPFCVCKDYAQLLLKKEIFEAIYLY